MGEMKLAKSKIREILEKMKDIINDAGKATDNSPVLEYQKPDSWISSLVPTT